MELLRCAGAKSKDISIYTESEDETSYNERKQYQHQQLDRQQQQQNYGESDVGVNGGMNIPEVNGDLAGMPSFTLIIKRGPSGFGFTVFGSSPVQVGRVEPGSPASEAGIMTDDFIVRINGVNVSRSTAESVARIVKDSERQIVLQVHRSTMPPPLPLVSSYTHTGDHCPSCPPSWAVEPWSVLPCPAAGSSAPAYSRSTRDVTPPTLAASVASGRQPFASIGNLQQRQRKQRGGVTLENGSSAVSERTSGIDCINNGLERRLVDGRQGSNDVIMTSTTNQVLQSQTNGRISPTSSITSYCDSCSKCQQSDVELQRSTNSNVDTSSTRQTAIRKLSTCEADFTVLMQRGLSCYLLPLENHPDILSSAEHAALFLNLETIQRLAEERSSRWKDYIESSSVDSLSAIYLPQIEAFYKAYEAYCGGVRSSIRLLVELKKSPEFEAFLKSADCNGQLTLSSVLKKPIEHIKDLVIGLQKVLNCTPSRHADYENLRQVVLAVRSCCNRINENNMYASSLSLASSSRDTVIPTSSRWSSTSRSTGSTTSSSSSSSSTSRSGSSAVAPPSVVASSNGVAASIISGTSSSSVISSIDSELLEIQTRLVFPKHIPVFHLATASHHLIYSGELVFVDCNARTSLYVVLMSDLLLLTRPDPHTGSLEVFEQPIGLQDIVGSNFMTSHPCEFVLSVETRVMSLQETWKPHPLSFRAPSVELKCTWKNILEQRILTCKAQRQQIVSSRSVDNIV